MAEISLVQNSDFRNQIREKLLGALVDLIPPDKFDKMLEEEVKAFFETETLLTVELMDVHKNGVRMRTSSHTGYGYHEPAERQVLAFGSRMTPFRQMAWTLLHEALSGHIKAALADNESEIKNEFTRTLDDVLKPRVKEVGLGLFQSTATAMSMGMMSAVINQAASDVRINLNHAFQQAGLNTDALNSADVEYTFRPPSSVPHKAG